MWTRTNGRTGKSWGQQLRVNGRVTNLGLGPYPIVLLAEAREKALTNRTIAYNGGDPRRRGMDATFAQLSEKVIALHAQSWKAGGRVPEQWRQSLRDYVLPLIGEKLPADVTRADVLDIVTPIWHTKPTVARQVLQRVSTILTYATARGLATSNVAEAGAIRAALPRKNGNATKHHKALPHGDVAAALAKVRASRARAAHRLALEFLVLTAGRTVEIARARWSEIDLEAGTWTIPAERMKAGREHRVPLSGPALAVLAAARELSDGSGPIFPSARTREALPTRVFGDLLDKLGIAGTPHGMRSSFRDWCSEVARVERAVAEAALAHTVKNATEAAYARSDLLDARRPLMEDWARYLEAPSRPAD